MILLHDYTIPEINETAIPNLGNLCKSFISVATLYSYKAQIFKQTFNFISFIAHSNTHFHFRVKQHSYLLHVYMTSVTNGANTPFCVIFWEDEVHFILICTLFVLSVHLDLTVPITDVYKTGERY